jgi:hypothetical protein
MTMLRDIVFVLAGIVMIWANNPWGWAFVVLGLFSLYEYFSKVEIPSTYNDLPMTARWKSYYIYSHSLVSADGDDYIRLADGSKISDYFSEGFRVWKGSGSLYVINKRGKVMYPGTK